MSYTESKRQEAIDSVLPEWLAIQKRLILAEELNSLKNYGTKSIDLELGKVIGQEDVIKALKPKLFTSILEMNLGTKELPTTFFFSGNSRMGKTYLAERIGAVICGRALVIPMANYTAEAHMTSLTGTSAGWAGYNDKTILEQYQDEIKSMGKQKYVLVFDEIEKADKSLQKFFLELLGTGTVTLLNGKTLDFKNSIIIFTSNLGTKFAKKKTIGFQGMGEDKTFVNGFAEEIDSSNVIQSIVEYFSPELINRIGLNNIFVFKDLNSKDKEKILLQGIQEALEKLKGKVDMNVRSVRMKIFNKFRYKLSDDNIGNIKKELTHEILMETVGQKFFK